MSTWEVDKERFEVVYKQSTLMREIRIVVDRETGVQYMQTQNGYSGGVTVLVDQDGKPLLYKG